MPSPSNLWRHALAAGLVVSAFAGVATIVPAAGAPAAPPDGTFEVHLFGAGILTEGGQQIAYEATCWNTAPNTGVTALIEAYLPPSPGVIGYSAAVAGPHPVDSNGFIAGQFHLSTNAPRGTYVIRVICVDGGYEVGRGETSLTVDWHYPDIIEPGPSAVLPTEPPPTAFAPPPPAAPVRGTARLTG